RDALREPIQIEGVPLVLVDTAGLRAAADVVERMGVERTQRELERADVVLAVHEAGHPAAEPDGLPADAERIAGYNNVDLAPQFTPPEGRRRAVAVSAKTGAGIDALRAAILKAAGWVSTGESVYLARERHLRAFESARAHLQSAADQLSR